MTETDKLLVRIGTARDAISRKTEQTSLDYMIDGVLMNCSVLLKKQEKLMLLIDENGHITPLTEQEPATVKAEIEGGGSSWWYVCSECHGKIDKNDQYCRHCGGRITE